MEKIKQNDIKGHNHKIHGNKGFVCNKCIFWIDMGEDELDRYNGCKIKNIKDYQMKNGTCNYSYNEYMLINKKI